MKKFFKALGIILLILLILFVLLCIGGVFYQKSAEKKDRALLEQDGFSNLVSAGDYNMNINIFGDGKYKIIAMPGSGAASFPIEMKQFSEYLGDDISLVVVSRPCYGLTEATDHDITTEYIVETTRTALKNAGIEGPYILMPHSLSGIYGTYWENVHPDEISGVIFLDSINEADDMMDDIPPISAAFSRVLFGAQKFLGVTGVPRLIGDLTGSGDADDSYGEYQADAAAFDGVNHTFYSKCYIQEIENFGDNGKTAWASIQSNDIPKIYISTNFASVEDAKEYLTYLYGSATDEEARSRYDSEQSDFHIEQHKKRTAYIEKLGNCEEINIPGSHFIYDQKPEEVAKVIEDFIKELE